MLIPLPGKHFALLEEGEHFLNRSMGEIVGEGVYHRQVDALMSTTGKQGHNACAQALSVFLMSMGYIHNRERRR